MSLYRTHSANDASAWYLSIGRTQPTTATTRPTMLQRKNAYKDVMLRAYDEYGADYDIGGVFASCKRDNQSRV